MAANRFFDSATVKGALVSGLLSFTAVLVAVWLPAYLEAPQLREEKDRLEKTIQDKDSVIAGKSHQIQELQTVLVPFKTVAFQNFSGTEAERLAQLAIRLNDVQKGLETLTADQATLKEKTKSITTLPDGRIDMGGVLTGQPTVLIARVKEMQTAIDTKDFETGYGAALIFAQLHAEGEKAASNSQLGLSGLNPMWLAEAYQLAADHARISKNSDKALEWIRKSIALSDSGSRQAALVLCLFASNSPFEADKLFREMADLESPKGIEFRETMERMGVILPPKKSHNPVRLHVEPPPSDTLELNPKKVSGS